MNLHLETNGSRESLQTANSCSVRAHSGTRGKIKCFLALNFAKKPSKAISSR